MEEKEINVEQLKKELRKYLINEYGKEKSQKLLKFFLNKKFKILINKIIEDISQNKKEKDYIVYIFLDEKLKDKYNPKLFNNSLKIIKQKLNVGGENIFIYYFKDLKEIDEDIIKGIPETPYYLVYEINKKEGIKLVDSFGGYILN